MPAGSVSGPSFSGPSFSGVVLCGGASRRMGRDKALIEIDGRAMARIAADALWHAGAVEVCCIGGDAVALAALGLDVVADRYPGEGPLGGLLSAFDRASAVGAGGLDGAAGVDADRPVMVLTCDLPLVDAAVVRPVVDALFARPGLAVAAPRIEDRLQLLSAAYRPALVRRAAQAAFAAGQRAVRAALETVEVYAVEGLDPLRLADADTPDRLPGGRAEGPAAR